MALRTIGRLMTGAALLALATTASAVCTDERKGDYFGAGFEPDMINVGCWMVRYDGTTEFVDSQDEPVTLADFELFDDVEAYGCELPDFTLQAERIVLVTPGAPRNCETVFEGITFGTDPVQQWVFLGCWAFAYDGDTEFENSLGASIVPADIQMGDELRITSCDDGLTWPPYAERVVKVVAGSNLASTSDAQAALDNIASAAYFVSNASDSAIAPVGAANTNPTITLEVGKRYMFSHASPAEYPFALIAAGATPALDTPLLVHGGGIGTMEGDPGVDWVEDGADFFFTVTPELVSAMGASPAYRCNLQPATMRGTVSLLTGSGVGDWMQYD